MSATTKSSKNSNDNCTREVSGKVCATFAITGIDEDSEQNTYDLTQTSGPNITNQQSNKPLNSNGQNALNSSLSSSLANQLGNWINNMAQIGNYYFMTGQSFTVCADFSGTVSVDGNNASANVSLNNITIV